MLEDETKRKIATLVRKIYENPELSGEEVYASTEVIRFLREEGFSVAAPIAGEKTAFKAEYTVRAEGKNEELISFAFCAEYDALPLVKHGCGHHLITGNALTAAVCLRKLLKEKNVTGRVVLFGCPAEETYGGKLKIADSGAADDVDAFLMAHPTDGFLSFGDEGYAGMKRVKVVFHGTGGSGVPRNASPALLNPLDASTLLYQALAMRRHFFPADVNIIGIIANGGERENILPVKCESKYTIRSQNPYVEFIEEKTLPPTRPNAVLSDAFLVSMKKRGRRVCQVHPRLGFMGATDFGIFSQMRPGCHLHFPIMAERPVAHHTEKFHCCAGRPEAIESMFATGESMAETAFSFITDKDFRASVKAEFAREVHYY